VIILSASLKKITPEAQKLCGMVMTLAARWVGCLLCVRNQVVELLLKGRSVFHTDAATIVFIFH
jgi:hypothetical protein